MKDLSLIKGISFPFRIGISGGVEMSRVTPQDFSHIDESIKQIIQTHKYERAMLKDFYSEVDTALFEPDNISVQTLISYEIEEALERLEPRVEIVSIDFEEVSEETIVVLTYKIPNYETEHILRMKVGE